MKRLFRIVRRISIITCVFLIISALFSCSSSTDTPAQSVTSDSGGSGNSGNSGNSDNSGGNCGGNNQPATLKSILLNTSSVKRYYGTGETLDLSGLTVTALYSDGTSSIVTQYSSVPSVGTVFNNLGLQTVTIIFEGESASFDIQILQDASFLATVGYEIYSDIPNLLRYDSLTHTFTALPNYDSYRWYVDDEKQTESSNVFNYTKGKNHTVTVIVNAAGKKYSAQMRIE